MYIRKITDDELKIACCLMIFLKNPFFPLDPSSLMHPSGRVHVRQRESVCCRRLLPRWDLSIVFLALRHRGLSVADRPKGYPTQALGRSRSRT